MTQAARLASRLQRELKMLQTDPPPGVCAWPSNDLLTHLEAQIQGPDGTVYSNGIFKLDIQVPERYPFEPPNVRFVTSIYHPNIDNGGRICLDILNLPPKGAWRPSLNLATVLASIGLLLAEPNPDDGLMGDITAEYKHNRASFDLKARKWTEQYATQEQLVQEVAPNHLCPDAVKENPLSNEQVLFVKPLLEVCKFTVPLPSESDQKLASSEGCDQKAVEDASSNHGSLVARFGGSLKSSKPGLSLSKRLTLERGTQTLQRVEGESTEICRKESSEKRNLSPAMVAEVCNRGSSGEDAPTEICRKVSSDKGNLYGTLAAEECRQGSSCEDVATDLCRKVSSGKGNLYPIMAAGVCKKGSRCDNVPTIICRKVSSDEGNLFSTVAAEVCKKGVRADKENLIPKQSVDLSTLKPMSADVLKALPLDREVSHVAGPPSGRGKLKLLKEAVEQVRPNCSSSNGENDGAKDSLLSRSKSLKLSRTKGDTHSSFGESTHGSYAVDGSKHLTDEGQHLAAPIQILDDVPTVIVSDSGSEDEPTEGRYRLSLTQKVLSSKRKARSKLR